MVIFNSYVKLPEGILCDTNIWQRRVETRRLNTEASGGEMRSLMPLQARLRGAQGWHG
jgi:hypothetical protein